MIFIGVGSSIGDAEKTFKQAQVFLQNQGICVLKKSKNLKNPAIGGVAKNNFTNAVWQIEFKETAWEKTNWVLLPQKRRLYLKAKKLLITLQACENHFGRTREKRWDDRTLDLDILMFHQLLIDKKRLSLPHSEIPNRPFVVLPWSEIVDEDFSIPKFGLLNQLIKKLKN